MSMFGDYKSYKTHAPYYKDWKNSFDIADAKRQEYLKRNPNEISSDDYKRGQALLRAIDTMDEYSQKRAEDMEVATDSVLSAVVMGTTALGMGLGMMSMKWKPVQNIFKKYAKDLMATGSAPVISGLILSGIFGTIASVPLYAWSAKKEIQASKKGRFESMRKDLKDPRNFAVLTEEQEDEVNKTAQKIPIKKEEKAVRKGLNDIKALLGDNSSYRKQRAEFEKELAKDIENFETKLTEEEILKAKKDKQLLSKIVEKLDIASQDYAENTELATSTATAAILAMGGLFSLGYNKLASKLHWKSSSLPMILSFVAMLGMSIFSATIQKQASRVGRFKAKQELLNNPAQFTYVDDEKVKDIGNVEVKPQKKMNIFRFMIDACKNNREYNKWKKTEGAKEKNKIRAMKNIKLSEEQLKDAKRLQHNTFKTFNKIDENSQKYSESVEALGLSMQNPIDYACTTVGAAIGLKYLNKAMGASGAAKTTGFMQYMSIILLSTVPSIIINAIITKTQKKASRVADMMAINELSDYRNFADYSKTNS